VNGPYLGTEYEPGCGLCIMTYSTFSGKGEREKKKTENNVVS